MDNSPPVFFWRKFGSEGAGVVLGGVGAFMAARVALVPGAGGHKGPPRAAPPPSPLQMEGHDGEKGYGTILARLRTKTTLFLSMYLDEFIDVTRADSKRYERTEKRESYEKHDPTRDETPKSAGGR